MSYCDEVRSRIEDIAELYDNRERAMFLVSIYVQHLKKQHERAAGTPADKKRGIISSLDDFLRTQLEAHTRREAHNVPHNVAFLENEIQVEMEDYDVVFYDPRCPGRVKKLPSLDIREGERKVGYFFTRAGRERRYFNFR